MSNQPRVVKVLAALLVSMTAGAIVLMALGDNPPSRGPWSLSNYTRLASVRQVIHSRVAQSPDRWSRIDVYYSGTRAGNIGQLASMQGLLSPKDINCHFVVCNGLGGSDGQIQPSEKWQRQWSVIPQRNWRGSERTIRICVVADGETTLPTNSQIRKIDELVQHMARTFNITPESIRWPADWR